MDGMAAQEKRASSRILLGMMMLAVALVAALGLTGCGVPSGFNERTYNLAKQAVEVGDDYMAGKVLSTEAKEKLDAIYSDIKAEATGNDELIKSRTAVTFISGMRGALATGDSSSFQNSLTYLKQLL